MSLSVLIKPAGPHCSFGCGYCFYEPLLNSLYNQQLRHRMMLETFELFAEQFMPLA